MDLNKLQKESCVLVVNKLSGNAEVEGFHIPDEIVDKHTNIIMTWDKETSETETFIVTDKVFLSDMYEFYAKRGDSK